MFMDVGYPGPGSHVHEHSWVRAAKGQAVTVQSRMGGGECGESD